MLSLFLTISVNNVLAQKIKFKLEHIGDAYVGTMNPKWYNKIKLNKKLLKNEGRFTISSPTAENNYECQITPVRMVKGKANRLDITFYHRSFRAHPISVMVQKPIIKKN